MRTPTTTISVVHDTIVVSVTGELDLVSADEFAGILNGALRLPGGQVVVDLSAVPLLDCAGYHALAHARRRACFIGRNLVLAAPQRTVRRMLALQQADAVFSICDTVDDAVTRGGGRSPVRLLYQPVPPG